MNCHCIQIHSYITGDPGNFSNTLIYMTMTNDRDVASKWASSQKMINKTLERMLEKFQ